MKDCVPWEGPHSVAVEVLEEEGAAEAKNYELTATPIPLHRLGRGGREVRSEAKPRKNGGVGGRCL